MANYYAQLVSGNWDGVNQWNTAADGSGSFATPGNGDTCDLNGKTVVMNLATIPASGSLAALQSTGTAGQLTLTMSGTNTYNINAATCTGGTKNGGLILTAGAAAGSTLNISGNVNGGTAAGAYGLAHGGTGTVNVGGNAQGGSNSSAYGINNTSTGTVNVAGSSTGSTARGINNNSTGTVNLGAALGGSASASYGVVNVSTGTITATAATGGSAATAYGIYCFGTGTVTVNGDATGGSHATAFGIFNDVAAAVTINGSLINTAQTSAVAGRHIVNSAAGRYTQHVATGGSTFKQYREDAHVTAAQVVSPNTFWANGVSGTGTAVTGGLLKAGGMTGGMQRT